MPEAHDGPIGSTRPGHYGAAGIGVALAEATITLAWNVQGDLAGPAFVAEARRLFDVALPLAPNTTARTGAVTALWLGPASWLLVARAASPLVDYGALPQPREPPRPSRTSRSASSRPSRRKRVPPRPDGEADARTRTRTSGPEARRLPLDFHPRAFATGTGAQSVFGPVNVLIDKRDDDPTFTVMVARSFARDVWHAFCEAAAQYGYGVLPPAPFR